MVPAGTPSPRISNDTSRELASAPVTGNTAVGMGSGASGTSGPVSAGTSGPVSGRTSTMATSTTSGRSAVPASVGPVSAGRTSIAPASKPRSWAVPASATSRIGAVSVGVPTSIGVPRSGAKVASGGGGASGKSVDASLVVVSVTSCSVEGSTFALVQVPWTHVCPSGQLRTPTQARSRYIGSTSLRCGRNPVMAVSSISRGRSPCTAARRITRTRRVSSSLIGTTPKLSGSVNAAGRGVGKSLKLCWLNTCEPAASVMESSMRGSSESTMRSLPTHTRSCVAGASRHPPTMATTRAASSARSGPKRWFMARALPGRPGPSFRRRDRRSAG